MRQQIQEGLPEGLYRVKMQVSNQVICLASLTNDGVGMHYDDDSAGRCVANLNSDSK